MGTLFSKFNGFKGNIWKMYLLKFFLGLHFMSAVLVPFYTDWGHISYAQMMFLQSWFMFWIFVLEIPTGTISDYFGRKTSIICAGIFYVFGVLIYTSYPSFYVFLLGEFIWASASAFLSGSDDSMIYDSLKMIKRTKDSKKIMLRIDSISMVGMAIAGPIGSFINLTLGLKWPMLLMAVPFSIALLIALTLKEPNGNTKTENKKYLQILKGGFNYFRQHKILRLIALEYVIFGVVSYFLLWLYQPIILATGYSKYYLGFIVLAITLAQLVFMNIFTKLENYIGSKRKIIIYSMIIVGISYLLLGFVSYWPILIVFLMISAGVGLGIRPVYISYMNKYIPSDKRATILSTISMCRQITIVISNLIVGLLMNYSIHLVIIILGLIIIIFAFISKVEEKHLKD